MAGANGKAAKLQPAPAAGVPIPIVDNPPADPPEGPLLIPERRPETHAYNCFVEELKEKYPGAERVSVRKLDRASGNWKTLGTVPIDLFDEDYLPQEHGAGLYEIMFRSGNNGFVGGKHRIEAGEVSKRAPASARPPAESAPAVSVQVELLKAELERRDQMLLRMIDAIAQQRAPAAAPATPGSTVTELVNALAALKKLEPAAAPVSFPEKLLERAFTMATKADGAGAADGRSELVSFLFDVWKEVKPQLVTPAAPAAAVANPPAADTTAADIPDDESEEDGYELNLYDSIESLKEHCRQQRPPALIADIVVDQLEADPDLKKQLVDLVDRTTEEVLQLDAELQMPAYRIWFTAFIERLRVRILGSSTDTGRAGGNTGNT